MPPEPHIPNVREDDTCGEDCQGLVIFRPKPNRPLPSSSEGSAFTKVSCKPILECESQGPHLSTVFNRPVNMQIASCNDLSSGFGLGVAERTAEGGRLVGCVQHRDGYPAQLVENSMTQLNRINFQNFLSIQSQLHREVRLPGPPFTDSYQPVLWSTIGAVHPPAVTLCVSQGGPAAYPSPRDPPAGAPAPGSVSALYFRGADGADRRIFSGPPPPLDGFVARDFLLSPPSCVWPGLGGPARWPMAGDQPSHCGAGEGLRISQGVDCRPPGLIIPGPSFAAVATARKTQSGRTETKGSPPSTPTHDIISQYNTPVSASSRPEVHSRRRTRRSAAPSAGVQEGGAWGKAVRSVVSSSLRLRRRFPPVVEAHPARPARSTGRRQGTMDFN